MAAEDEERVSGRVLVVDDDPAMRSLLAEEIGADGYAVTIAESGAAALVEVEARPFDAVVSDVHMPGMTGIELCARVHGVDPDLPVIVITAFGNMEKAIAAIRVGAYDFLPKPFEVEQLMLIVQRATRLRRLRREVVALREQVHAPARFRQLLGESPPMLRLRSVLDRVARVDAAVLIRGETGSGKELVARAIHDNSARAAAPFVAVSMAAVPAALVESELFGHVRGAFTDARSKRDGLFLQAEGGTLLLDEIGEMPMELQPKLLRALEERQIRPVGSDREVPIDVRVLAATHRDLEAAIEEGRFREDLYFRLDVLDVETPPLRARGQDILLLAQSFLERIAAQYDKPVRSISHEAAERLLDYPWPGNVRELRNCIERAVALSQHEELTVGTLPERVQSYHPSHVVVVADGPEELMPLEVVERRYILRVLEAVGSNKSLAAKVLGIGRKTLYRKLELYGYQDP